MTGVASRDGSFARFFGIAPHMIKPETTIARFAEIISEFFATKNLADFLLDGLGSILPDDFKYISNATDVSS
jgi:hypothetical protein